MKTFKHYLALSLAIIMCFTSVDLTFIDLSPITVLAAEGATDCYDAYDDMKNFNVEVSTVWNNVKNNLKLNSVNSQVDQTPVNNDLNPTDLINGWVSNLGVNTGSTGLYTFNMTPEATVQVKSGNWLNDTKYEAMAGTPTTENLFVTFGGTQWIVDLQYRLMQTDYLRTYVFEASAANYRYYKLGDIDKESTPEALSVRYTGQLLLDPIDNPLEASKVETSDGRTISNFVYRYFEGGDKENEIPTTTHAGAATGGESYEYNTADDWSQARVDNNVAGMTYEQGDTTYVTPNVATATLFKQEVAAAITELKSMWADQADNYRADQSVYNVDDIYEYPDKTNPDKLTFMYTYGGMLRKGTINGTGQATKGNTTYSTYFWQPVITSYFYDWTAYELEDAMDYEYGSSSVKFQTLREVTGYSDTQLRSCLESMLGSYGLRSLYENNSAIHAYTNVEADLSDSKFEESFALSLGSLPDYLSDVLYDTTSQRMQADLYWACQSAKFNGTDVTVALNDIGNAYAFSAGLKNSSTSNMGLDYTMLNVDSNSDLKFGSAGIDFTQGGWNELGYLYYRAVYSMLLNWGQFFYYDEAVQLFEGIPGFNANDWANADAYNAKVANNLRACFGQCYAQEVVENTSVITFPFAAFPRGGDLDGCMELSDNSNLSTALNSISAQQVYLPSLLDSVSGDNTPASLYCVKVTISLYTNMDYTSQLSDNGVLVTYTRHAWEQGTGQSTEGGYLFITGTGLPEVHDSYTFDGVEWTCSETREGYAYADCRNTNCNNHEGTVSYYCASNSKRHVDDDIWRCLACGYKQSVNSDNPWVTQHECAACDGLGIRYMVEPTDLLDVRLHYPTFTGAEITSVEDRVQNQFFIISAIRELKVCAGDWSDVSYMSDSQKLAQQFEDVEWLDITSYKLWQIHTGTMKGLSQILYYPSDSLVNGDEIVSKAVNKLGYTVYNNTYKDKGTSIVNSDGTYYSVENSIRNDLQSKGIVANSFNPGSIGNTRNQTLTYGTTLHDKGEWAGKVSEAVAYCYLSNDSPILRVGSLVNQSPYNSTVKNLASYRLTAQSVSSGGDTLYFEYYPYSQGGRSHTTFSNFVNQALANTLYTVDTSHDSTYISPTHYKIGFSNSLLIQGDYLSLNRSDGSDLVLAGSFHDTWSERNKSATTLSGGKFSLVPDGHNTLANYSSTCNWIPARYAYILSRVDIGYLYEGLGTSKDNAIESTNNCWMIHSYCGAINSSLHNGWDSAQNETDTKEESCQGGYCNVDTKNCKGDVNPLRNIDKHFSNLEVIKLSEILLSGVNHATTYAEAYYNCSPDIDGNVTTIENVNANYTILHVPLSNSVTAGENTTELMTDLSGVQSSMPYVGYQESTNGTEDITLNDSTATQKGYTVGYDSKFDISKVVGLNTNYGTEQSTFGMFGTRLKTDIEVVSDVDRNNKASGADTFSEQYPWLQDLNIVRNLPNGVYKTGEAYVNYTVVGQDSDDTVTNKQHTVNGDTLRISAAYIKDNSTSVTPNNIVIYNPVSSESAHIVALSEFMPSSTNYGTDGTYLGSFGESLRDQRVSDRLDFVNDDSGENYLSGSGILRQTLTTGTSTTYEPKVPSEYNTLPYTQGDYVITTGVSEGEFINDYTTSYYVSADGKYNLTKFKTNTLNVSGEVNLREGDVISFLDNEDSAVLLTMGTNNFELPYDSFINAYFEYEEDLGVNLQDKWTLYDIGIPLTKGMLFSIETGNMQLRPGSLLKVTLNVTTDETNTATGIDDAITLNNISNCTITSANVSTETDAKYTTYTWFIEANKEVSINSLSFTVSKDCLIKSYDGNAISNEKVLLMNLGNGTSTSQTVNSYQYFYGNRDYSYSKSNPNLCINSLLVKERSSYDIEGCVISDEGFYINLDGTTSSVSLSDTAMNDAHKVPNTNWRYYVLGWSTDTGHIITKVSDPVLSVSTTKLLKPAGGFVTVGELLNKVNSGTLGVYRYNGTYGLFDLNSDGTFNRKSTYTGIELAKGSTFDIITFGDGASEFISGLLPAMSTDIDESSYQNSTDKSYEVVFKATNSSEFDVASYKYAAYSVKYSGNLAHKVSDKTDSKDWNVLAVEIPSFDAESYSSFVSNTISLDDEFTIYWDNYGNLSPNVKSDASNLVNVQNTLGRGWEVGVNPLANSIWSKYTNNSTNKLVDTTQWIYQKYVVFNVDVYTFGDNPTTPAYNADGSKNTAVLHKAGEPIYLGTYSDTNAGDNTCRFVDYGEEGVSKDPNGDLYTYHFWCPLSNGETVAGASAHFVVNSINSDDGRDANGGLVPGGYSNVDVTTDATAIGASWVSTMNSNSFLRTLSVKQYYSDDTDKTTPIEDEWGKLVLDAVGLTMRNNAGSLVSCSLTDTAKTDALLTFNTEDCFRRYDKSVNTVTMSIMGRVGNLTIVDSGDPRYQDTFKIADPDWAWAISPIVVAIEKYSNVLNTSGSQNKYLSDLIDVRGRLISETNDSNTYGTQEFQSESGAERDYLPADSDFNIHKEMQSSLQTIKLGYELYCSLETIGNYFGSSGKRTDDTTEQAINNNLDYGQTKVQIHPMYIAIPKNPSLLNGDKPFAVDVYMRKGGSYALINAGSAYASASEARNAGSSDSGPYYLDDAFDATYTSSISTNTEDVTTLDANLLRRLVSNDEADTTISVLNDSLLSPNVSLSKGITKSILNSNSYGSDELGADGLNYSYIYGNAQMLFLREYNRTFIGGNSSAISAGTDLDEDAQKYAQKWYFGLGLPASAVFVKHGVNITESNIISADDYYILCVIDVYVIGEKWVNHYVSPIADSSLTIGSKTYTKAEWNVYKDNMPYLLPVAIYDITSTSSGDMDSTGSH